MLPPNASPVPTAAPHSGPAVAPQGHAGTLAQAAQKLHSAAKLINEILPVIPMGTEAYNEVFKLAGQMNKLIEKIPNIPGVQATQLQQAARDTAAKAPQDVLNSMFPPGGGGAAPGGPPPPAQPQLPAVA